MRGIISIFASATCPAALFAASFLPAPAVKQMITNEIATSYSTHSFSQAVNRVVAIPAPDLSQTYATPEFSNAVNNVVAIPESSSPSTPSSSDTSLLSMPEFTNAVKSVVTEDAPTGSHVWKFHGSDYETLSQTYTFTIEELWFSIRVYSDCPYFYTGSGELGIHDIYSNCFYVTEGATSPSPNFWLEKVYVTTNKLGFVKQSEIEHIQWDSLTNTITTCATNAVTGLISNSVDHAIRDKVLTDWTFFPEGDYSVTHSETEGEVVDGKMIVFTLYEGGVEIESCDVTVGPDGTADEVTFLEFSMNANVVARRKWVSKSGIALIDDVQGTEYDSLSIGLNAIGQLEVRGFGDAVSAPTNPAVFVKMGTWGTWYRLSEIIDTNTLYISSEGKICAKDYSRRHPWAWVPDTRSFTNAVVQLTRSITTVSSGSAVNYVTYNNAVTGQSTVSPLPVTGVYFVTVYHDTLGTRLNVITKTGSTTKADLTAMRNLIPPSTDTQSNFYVATVFEGEQIDGIYAMPTCFLWE